MFIITSNNNTAAHKTDKKTKEEEGILHVDRLTVIPLKPYNPKVPPGNYIVQEYYCKPSQQN